MCTLREGRAHTNDLIRSLYGRFPIVALIVIMLTFVSLMVLFRSVVIPLKAVVLNTLSILASFGALVWVFQQGNLSGLLDFEPLGITEATTPIALFAILFGLSMDYEIFLLVADQGGVSGDGKQSREREKGVGA